MINSILSFLKSKRAILLIFIGIEWIGLFEILFYRDHTVGYALPYEKLLFFRSISTLVYSILVFLALKNIKLFNWIMTVVLFFSGLHSLMVGVFRFGANELFIKSIYIGFGLYFIFGTIILTMTTWTRKIKEENGVTP